MGRHHDATSWAATALRARPNYQPAIRLSAVSNALSGNIQGARRAMQRLQQVNPRLSLCNLKDNSPPFRRAEDLAKYAEGLRKAGLQDN
jgi:hypothetical protein